MQKIISFLLVTMLVSSFKLSTYFYGPQSPTNDVNSNSSLVIVAFATINSDGTVALPTPVPCENINTWKSRGMKVFFSIGGQGANWTSIFSTNASMNASIASIAQILSTSPFQGVDLDMQQYTISPFVIGNWIKNLKSALNGAYVIVTPQCVGVYQGQPVPTTSTWNAGDYWNFWVPIFNIALGSIDGVQVQAYNNWYDGLNEGSLAYLQDVTLQWLNKPSTFCVGCSVLTNFAGIPSNKLVIGIPASTSAGSGYPLPSVLAQFITWTQTSGNSIAAMMIWDSHWDSLNNYIASNTIIQGQMASPLTPTTPTISNICSAPPLSKLYVELKSPKTIFNHAPPKNQQQK